MSRTLKTNTTPVAIERQTSVSIPEQLTVSEPVGSLRMQPRSGFICMFLLILVLGLMESIQVAGAAVVPVCIDDLCFPIETDTIDPAYYTSNRYWVKKADFNSDGYMDLYVTGRSDRAVDDFIVYQQPQFKYSVGMADASHHQVAAGAAMTSIVVHRRDLTADGVFDFELEYVSEAIPDSPDIVILTQKDIGTPRAAVPRDDQFEQLLNSFEVLLDNLEYFAGVYTAQHCSYSVLYIPIEMYNIWDYVPPPGGIPNAAFAEGEWSWQSGTQSGGASHWTMRPLILGSCTNGGHLFSSEGRELMQAIVGFQGSGASEARATQVTNQILRRVSVQTAQRQIARALLIRTAAMAATAALLADDATVIGVIDDIGLVVTVAMIGYSIYSEYNYQRYIDGEIGEDFGIGSQPQETPDPYRVKPECKPWDAQILKTQRSAELGRPSPKSAESWRLRRNLERAGCGCPPGKNINAAHHMIEKGDMSADAVAARACLKQAGIDLDWAGNGICLPTNDTSATKSLRHWDLHGPAYNAQMRLLCEEALRTGGPQSVRDALDDVRSLLSEGTKFW